MDKKELVRNIIKTNFYLSLSTCDKNMPWIAPVRYIVDEEYNFYFVSPLDSLHAQHMLKNPHVAFAIFDSRQPPGTGTGIQAKGKVSAIKEKDYPPAVREYFNELKTMPIKLDAYAVFMIAPISFYIPNDDAWEKEGVDRRIEVKIRE